MNILLLGGKKFLGYHIALEAEKRGHKVTFFNRGKTYHELLPQFPCITGDRDKDMHLLEGKTFDAVIDTCAYFPKQVEKTVDVLGDHIDKYLLVSSISACDLTIANLNEEDPVCGLDYESEEITGETYGPLKAACEQLLQERMGVERSLIIRPGYIVGERDHTDRFSYWPVMMANMDRMIVPETGELGFQYMDVRDTAAFIMHTLEKDMQGTYIVTGPVKPYKFHEFIRDCQEIINPNCELVSVDDAWFQEKGLEKFIEFPLCDDIEGFNGAHCVDISKAIQGGLKNRPLKDTLLSTLEWYRAYKGDVNQLAVGMKAEVMKKYLMEV